jgi:hypothetical protein
VEEWGVVVVQGYSKLLIVWTSGDRDVALNMVFMYAINSKLQGWWKDVVLLIWGSSTRLSAQDKEIQERIASAQKEGVRVIACKRCAENLHVVEELERLGIEVFYTGEFLTDWLKSGERILTI